MQKLCILGATGSIGTSALEVVRQNRGKFCVQAVCAMHNADKLYAIIREFKVPYAALQDRKSAARLREMLRSDADPAVQKCEVLEGEEGICALASLEHDFTLAAIVGAAGLKPVWAALQRGRTIGLANKEALVMSGKLFFETARKYHATVLPVDSEHSAIFQCLPENCQRNMGYCDLKGNGVHKILLTGSGGPFRTRPLNELGNIKAEEALHHPVWSMGPKITIDSATMMNKGLEFIEARYLFNAGCDDIDIIVHPQSVVHSMVSYKDGAVLAQLGRPDMKTPIARALAFPDRLPAGVQPLDFCALKELSFAKPDFVRYPCLKLAIQASKSGQYATTALNAANEVAVAAFLEGRIGYTDIAAAVEHVLTRLSGKAETSGEPGCLEDILQLDTYARALAAQCIASQSF